MNQLSIRKIEGISSNPANSIQDHDLDLFEDKTDPGGSGERSGIYPLPQAKDPEDSDPDGGEKLSSVIPWVAPTAGLGTLLTSREAQAQEGTREDSTSEYVLPFIGFLILAGATAAWMFHRRNQLNQKSMESTPPPFRDRISSVEEEVRKSIGFEDADSLQVTIRESDPGEELRFLPLAGPIPDDMEEVQISRVYSRMGNLKEQPMELNDSELEILKRELKQDLSAKMGFETWALLENKIPRLCYSRYSNLAEGDRQVLLRLHTRGMKHFYGETH